MINVQIGERYPGHDTLSLRLRRCCSLLCICMQPGQPHILCLPYELGSIPPVNLISNMRTFHGLGTTQKLFFCLFTCYIPTIGTMFIFPIPHYKHCLDIHTHSRPSPRVHCHSPRPLQAAACCLSNMIIQAGSL